MNRRRVNIVLFVLVAAAIAVAVSNSIWPRRHSFFGQADADAAIMKERLADIDSVLGIQRWKFEFRLPPQHTLFATFRAEFNGEPVVDMSRTYHVVPKWPSESTDGAMDIGFYHPRFETKLPEAASWILSLSARNERKGLFRSSGTGVGNTFRYVSPFDPSGYTGDQGNGETYSSANSLAPGREYEIWEYTAHGRPLPRGYEEPYEFKYVLTIRMESLKDGEKPGVQPIKKPK
ncbi:MAG: hypothetical protein KY476_13705 [Planctomycetes bacterium]|nr:hypothetical protein [Planctomycetota bacterium]